MRTKTLKKFDSNIKESDLKITLCDHNPDIANTLVQIFKEAKNVEVVQGNILYLQADAIVSPTNSFGDMSGGLDKAIDNFFEGEAQRKIQAQIRTQYYGELQVGNALTIKMDNTRFPNIVFAPTMRIPATVKNTINAYLAMRAILIEAKKFNFSTIVIPSLCSGIGKMPYVTSAEQMYVAYQNIMLEHWKNIVHPVMAPYAYK